METCSHCGRRCGFNGWRHVPNDCERCRRWPARVRSRSQRRFDPSTRIGTFAPSVDATWRALSAPPLDSLCIHRMSGYEETWFWPWHGGAQHG